MNGYLLWVMGWLFTVGTIVASGSEFLNDSSFWESLLLFAIWPAILGAYFAG